MRQDLKKHFAHGTNRNNGFRLHELVKLIAGYPLSIKMLASYFKNQDINEFKIKDLYELVKEESKKNS